MRIKLKTVMCGPFGNFAVGQIADFDDTQARALIDGGYADAVDAPVMEIAALAPPETGAAPYQKRIKRGQQADRPIA